MEIKILKKVKRHWVAILIAIVLGILLVLPFFYFQSALREEYKGVQREFIDDELFYMARIKDVIDGYQTLGNAYLYEHKNQLPQQLFLPEFILAQPLKILNLNIVQGRILYSFLLPVLAFILTYIAFYLIQPSRLWANLFAVFLFFGLYLFKFTRPVIPQFVFLFWLSQFIFLWQFLKSPSNRTFKLLSILNFGLLFYIYPFYWTFYLVFLAVLIFFYFFRNKAISKQFLKILIGGLIIGLVYFCLTFLASQLPEYQETLTRLQLVFSRSPSEIKSSALALAVLLFIATLYWPKTIKPKKETMFFITGIVSVILVTNQNIITGLKFEFGHYRMLAIFFSALTFYYLWNNLISLNFKIRSLILSLVIIMSFGGVYSYIQRVVRISDQDIYAQKYADVFDWFNANTPKDSVVYANEEISQLVPVYTSNNVFYVRSSNLFFISDPEVLERFILNNYFEKFDRDFVIQNERSIWGVRYIDRYGDAVQANKWRIFLGLKLKDDTRLPEEEVNKIMIEAEELQNSKLKDGLRDYRANYLVWDREKDPHWKISENDFKKIADFSQFAVFEIH